MQIRAVALACFAWLAVLTPAAAQRDAQADAQARTTTPDDLRAPLAPAFALLDVTPTSIDRPQSARALTLNLVSAFRENEGLPRNYALEVTPYWLRSHPTLTFDQYYNPTLLQTIVRTFAVSVATTSVEATEPEAPGRTSLGIGVRSLLAAGRAHPLLEQARDDLVAVTIDQAKLDDPVVMLEFERDRARREGRDAEVRKLQDAIDVLTAQSARRREELAEKARAINLRIQELDKDRVGLLVSLAAAHVTDFAGDRFEDREVGRWGVWLTPAYRVLVCGAGAGRDCQATADVMAVVRYIAERRGAAEDSTWDVGGRVLWQPAKEFGISIEILKRGGTDATGGDSSNRTVGVLEYRVRDDIVLFGSFGKDFEPPGGGRTLVSLLGLNFGFGRKPLIDLTRE